MRTTALRLTLRDAEYTGKIFGVVVAVMEMGNSIWMQCSYIMACS